MKNKKILGFFISVFLILSLPLWVFGNDETARSNDSLHTQGPIDVSPFKIIPLTARVSFVYDSDYGFLYRSAQLEKRIFPASITKLFSALTALDYLSPQDKATVGDELNLVAPDASVAGLKKGFETDVDTLLAAMMLRSGNDAAYTIAATAGAVLTANENNSDFKNVDAFLQAMNAKAKSMGLTGTHFENPDGYHHPEHYTTLADMVIISKAVMNCPLLLHYTRMTVFRTVIDGETVVWKNTNHLLHPSSPFYRKSTVGLKTGFTDSAGYCMVTAETTKSGYVLAGVFGCSSFELRTTESVFLLEGAEMVRFFLKKKNKKVPAITIAQSTC